MGKGVIFMLFMWMIVSIAGGVMQGSVSLATTTLTEAIDDSDTTITVTSTAGFENTGFIVLLDERIGYSSITDTTFEGSIAQPLLRGTNDTDAIAHAIGEKVRTVESSMMNSSLGYHLAIFSDSSGAISFVTMPFAFVSLLASFFVLPLAFLGSDLEILTYIWGVLSIGIIVSLGISLAGGRRMS